jgi:hypothetical protein
MAHPSICAAAIVGTTLVGALTTVGVAHAGDNPFASKVQRPGCLTVAAGEAKPDGAKTSGNPAAADDKTAGGEKKPRAGQSDSAKDPGQGQGRGQGMKDGKCGEGKCGGAT